MRISVEMDDRVVSEIMEMTGERKMSAAIAKAAEMFTKRQKAVALIRTLREDPLDYGMTNEGLEETADPDPVVADPMLADPMMEKRVVSYRAALKKMPKA